MYGKVVNLKMGSAAPKNPGSSPGSSVAGGNHPGSYSPASAAKHLDHQDGCAPANDGPMKKAIGSKSIA